MPRAKALFFLSTILAMQWRGAPLQQPTYDNVSLISLCSNTIISPLPQPPSAIVSGKDETSLIKGQDKRFLSPLNMLFTWHLVHKP